MSSRIASTTPIYQRGARKRHIAPVADGQRKPRERDADHLGCVAQLQCAVPGCGSTYVHVAHVRYASAADEAPLTGKQEKPSDWRVVPLCPAHHNYGPDAQHSSGEREWWQAHGINPYGLARALYNLTGQIEKMQFIVRHARLLFPARTE